MDRSVEICTSRASKYLRCSVWARKINSLKGSANSARTSSRVQSFGCPRSWPHNPRALPKTQAGSNDAPSAEPAGDVILGAFVGRGGEDLLRLAEFHDFAQKH